MKLLPAAAFLLAVGVASPAFANAHTDAPADANAESEAPVAQAAALTIDTPIESLMADEGAKAIVVKHLGPLDQHPAYGQFATMSLVQLQPWSQGAITDEAIEMITAELAEMGEEPVEAAAEEAA